MAEQAPLNLQLMNLRIKNRLFDIRFITVALLFILGWLALIAQIETSVPLFGPLFTSLRTGLQFVGPWLRLFLWVLMGAFAYELLMGIINKSLQQEGVGGLIVSVLSSALVMYLLVALIQLMPQLLPALFKDGPVQSITGLP